MKNIASLLKHASVLFNMDVTLAVNNTYYEYSRTTKFNEYLYCAIDGVCFVNRYVRPPTEIIQPNIKSFILHWCAFYKVDKNSIKSVIIGVTNRNIFHFIKILTTEGLCTVAYVESNLNKFSKHTVYEWK